MTIPRKGADHLLRWLVERAALFNNNSVPYRIEALIVFGSYLGHKERLGNLDVAVWFAERDWKTLEALPDQAKAEIRQASLDHLKVGQKYLSMVEVKEDDLANRLNCAIFFP